MGKQLDVIQTYIHLVQSFNSQPEAYAEILHPDIELTEYPNLLQKTLQRRSFSEILHNVRLARELLREPNFEVKRTLEGADGSVTVEGIWQATTTSDLGQLMRGQRLYGHVCLVFEFLDGKIYRQRRYSCYDLV